jgi:hypothetical protein
MKQNIPIFQQLSADELALYSQNEGFETKIIYLKVGDLAINLNQIRDSQLTIFGSDQPCWKQHQLKPRPLD